MKIIRVATDLDDTCFDFTGTFADWHNRNYGTHLTLADFRTSRMEDALRLSGDVAKQRASDFIDTPEGESLPVFPEVKRVMRCLKGERGAEWYAVTSRVARTESTPGILEREFPGCFSGVYFSRNTCIRQGMDRKSKAEICRDLRADFFIEDVPEYALECADAGIYVLLFNQPWNQKCPEHPNMKRVNNWNEIALSI